MNSRQSYRVQAYNTSKLSENKIHDDTVARRFRFSDGLVPDGDEMAYMLHLVLVDNAILGPWIHVGSRMQLLSAAKTGDELTARAKVTGNYDKKGHRFVELDALVVANGTTPLAHCWHIAIYQPREQAAA